jgi:hypothetical protein
VEGEIVCVAIQKRHGIEGENGGRDGGEEEVVVVLEEASARKESRENVLTIIRKKFSSLKHTKQRITNDTQQHASIPLLL